MRDALLDAVSSGRLEELRAVMDLNELPPELGAEPVSEPIKFWRKLSADGTGADILAALALVLAQPPVATALGKDLENTRQFIWPAFADQPLTSLTPAELDQLHQLESPAKAAQMIKLGRYTGWRVVIGGDGVWHSFRRYD